MPNKINGPMRIRAGDRLNIAHQAIDILRDHLQTGSKGRKSLPYFFSISKMWTQRKFFFGIGPGQSHMKNLVGGSTERNPYSEQRNAPTRVPLRSGTLDPS